MYLSSNGAMANGVHRDLDVYFQGQTISGIHVVYNIWKTVISSEQCRSSSFIDVDIGQRMAPLRMLYIATSIYISRSHNFWKIILYTILGKR